jgi:UDP-N-acetyl-D-mannosaminuronic acid dehydrogenase
VLRSNESVAVVGYGYVGAVVGAVLANRGFNVVGIDPDVRIGGTVAAGIAPVREAGLDSITANGVREGRLRVTSDPAAASNCTTVLITVGTPLSAAGDADLDQITRAAEELAPYLSDGQLVMLKSTVPPGCTARLAPILRRQADVRVAFCPERLAEGRAVEEFLSIPIIVGGVDRASTVAAVAFWQRALDVDVIEVSSSCGAELVKLADNLWIDLNIALANELAQLCDKLGGIDVLEVIRAANTLPKVDYNVNILMPSIGVGGYCLTKDPWFVHSLGKHNGLELRTTRASRETNDAMSLYSAMLIDRCLADLDRKNPSNTGKRIAVLGISFKNDTGDCRSTPTLPIIKFLMEKGHQLVLHDPWVDPIEAEKLFPLPLEASFESAVRDADCVAYFAGHRQFRDFPLERLAQLVRPGALIFDGRMYFDNEAISSIKSFQLAYKGVGR